MFSLWRCGNVTGSGSAGCVATPGTQSDDSRTACRRRLSQRNLVSHFSGYGKINKKGTCAAMDSMSFSHRPLLTYVSTFYRLICFLFKKKKTHLLTTFTFKFSNTNIAKIADATVASSCVTYFIWQHSITNNWNRDTRFLPNSNNVVLESIGNHTQKCIDTVTVHRRKVTQSKAERSLV